jgi:hypothetical protein
MNKGRIIAAYICLVGGPLLGLIGVLRAGARLTPPRAVRGNWIVQADFSLWHGMPCEALLAHAPQPLLNIAQSGRDVTVTLSNPENIVLVGTVDGPNLTAAPAASGDNSGPAPKQFPGCPDPRSLRLQARVSDLGKDRSLKGTFSLDHCSECSPLAFSAVRQVPDGRSTR